VIIRCHPIARPSGRPTHKGSRVPTEPKPKVKGYSVLTENVRELVEQPLPPCRLNV
jgi:hypothetical protein